MSHPNRGKVKNWPEYLKAFRKRHKLQRKQLADLLMISVRNIENWEEAVHPAPAYLKLALKDVERKLQEKKDAANRPD